MLDRVVEPFSGFHDFLNHALFYNIDGTSHNFLPQLGKLGYYTGESISAFNVLLASPVAAASMVPDHLRWTLTTRRK